MPFGCAGKVVTQETGKLRSAMHIYMYTIPTQCMYGYLHRCVWKEVSKVVPTSSSTHATLSGRYNSDK